MTSDVVLTAALRNNLLSLQKTQSSIDKTQLNLATGRKVNSALDGPQAFFASQALNNRASDLTRLLDGIGQSIQVIKAADNGITALTSLVEQADSIANSARDALAQGTSEAKVTGNVDLRGIDDLASVSGIAAAGTDTLTFTLTDEDGNAENIGAYGAAEGATATVTIAQNMSSEELVAAINNIHIGDGTNAVGDQAFEASLDEGGNLQIKSLNGGDYRVVFAGGGGAGDTDSEDLALANALGLGGFAKSAGDQSTAGDTSVEFTAIADVALKSHALVKNVDGDVADRSTLLSDLRSAEDTATDLFTGIVDASSYTIAVNGDSRQTIDLADVNDEAISVQGFIDSINNNDTLNTQIEATFDEATGQISIRTLDASVTSVEIGITGAAATADFGFGTTTLATDDADAHRENIVLASAAGDLASFESEYNNIRSQITELVSNGDTGYRGTNLLNGDDLLTTFNENRTSSLTSNGETFTADGLGISEANFSRESSVEDSLSAVRDALESIRAFGSSLANDLSVIQTRESFAQSTINTLTEGADKLTVADQNAEGAKLLALQTRQQLGVTSLALASQSQQSILRLF